MKSYKFVKEDGIWYIDLPEFLELGLGTRANLMMVAGADTLLDKLSSDGQTVTTILSADPFDGASPIKFLYYGHEPELLASIGHPEVDHGAYYALEQYNGEKWEHELWLCPVTRFVFGGEYPETIYFKVK